MFELDVENAIMYYNLLHGLLFDLSEETQFINDSDKLKRIEAFIEHFGSTEDKLKEFIENNGRYKICPFAKGLFICNKIDCGGFTTCFVHD